MDAELVVSSSERNGSRLWTVEGEIDLATIPVLEQRLEEATSSGVTELLIDMSRVSFIDSSGLRALLAVKDALPRVVLVAPSRSVRRLLEVVELGSAIEVFDTVEEAERG